MTPEEREAAEARVAELKQQLLARQEVKEPVVLSGIERKVKEERVALLEANMPVLAERNAESIFNPYKAPPEEVSSPEVVSNEQAELDRIRGTTLARLSAGAQRPVTGTGQLLVKALNNSKPVTDFFDVAPFRPDENNEGSKFYQGFPYLFDEKGWDESNKEFKESNARGRKVYADEARETYDRLAAANVERDKLPYKDRTLGNSNKIERLGAYLNTSIKGEGDWDTAGMVGQIGASIPAIAAAGPSIGGQILAGTSAGLTTPSDDISGEGFTQEKTLQGIFGGIFGLVGGSVPRFLEYASPYFKLLFDSDNAGKTAQMIRAAIKDEDKAEEIITLLRADAAAAPLAVESAGEVAARVDSPEFAATSELADYLNPGMANTRGQEQLASRGAAFDSIIDEGPPAIQLREEVTTPIRTEVLDLAEENSAARAALDNAQDILIKDRDAPFRTREQIAADNASSITSIDVQRQAAIDALDASIQVYKDKNISAITTENIFSGLNTYSKNPEVVGNPVVGKALSQVRNDLQAMVRPDGTIDPLALYTYRKTGMDSAISRYLNPEGNTTLEQGVIDAMVSSKALLDETIEGALEGKAAWTQGYLELYNKMSRPVNQAKTATVLKQSLTSSGSPNTQTPKVLAAALAAQEEVIKKAGVGGRTFKDVFDNEQIQLLDDIGAGVANTVEHARLAVRGGSTGRAGVQAESPTLANALIREVMIANKVFSTMSKRRQAQIEKHLAILFTRDPAQGYIALAKALEGARPGVKKNLLGRIFDGAKDVTARGATLATQATLPVAAASFAGDTRED